MGRARRLAIETLCREITGRRNGWRAQESGGVERLEGKTMCIPGVGEDALTALRVIDGTTGEIASMATRTTAGRKTHCWSASG